MAVGITITGENQIPQGSSEGSFPDFGALREQASAMMNETADDVPAVPVVAPTPLEVRVKGASDGQEVPAPKEVPAAEAVAEETPAEVVETAAKAALSIGDDDLVTVMVDGEEQTLPWKEARGNISGGMKFTKSMQTLATERQAFATERSTLAELQTEREKMRNFLSDPAAVMQFLQVKHPGAFGQPAAGEEEAAYDPNEIATVGQARTIAEQQMAQFQTALTDVKAKVEAQIADASALIEHKQQQAKHAGVIQSTLADIFTKNPVLKAIPDVEDIIRYNVAKMQPTTEAEALQAFRSVSQGMVDELGKHYAANKKVQAVAAAKARLESKSIEPAGGAAPQIQPTSYKNADGSMNWKAVTQAAKDFSG